MCVCRSGLRRFYHLSFMYILVSVCVCREGLARFYELSFMYILRFYELSFMYILVSLCVQRRTGTFLRVVLHVYPCIVYTEMDLRFYELSFMYILVSLCVQKWTGAFLRVVLHVYPCIAVCTEMDRRVFTSCPSCISLYLCVCREGLARFYELSFMYILVSLCVQKWTGAFLRVVLHVYPCIVVCAERDWHASTSCPSCISLYPCVGLARFYELSFMYRPILVSLCVCREGLARFYELSFMWYSLLAVLIVVIVGIVTSLITGDFNQSINVLFYVCSQQGEIRQKQKQKQQQQQQ